MKKYKQSECAVCHKPYTPTSGNQKTCPGKCQKIAYDAAQKQVQEDRKARAQTEGVCMNDMKKAYRKLVDKSVVRPYFFALLDFDVADQRKILKCVNRVVETVPGLSAITALELVGRVGQWHYQNARQL